MMMSSSAAAGDSGNYVEDAGLPSSLADNDEQLPSKDDDGEDDRIGQTEIRELSSSDGEDVDVEKKSNYEQELQKPTFFSDEKGNLKL